MTTQQAYNDFLREVNKVYELSEAINISDWVFENTTGLKRLERSLQKNSELQTDKLIQLKKYEEELLKHRPVQYVINEAWFYKMKFYVNEYVLIPRPETEELVEWIVEDVRNKICEGHDRKFKILDIGSGSGCIPISLKKNLENAQLTSIDVSAKALEVANRNALALNTPVNFIQQDFLDENLWDTLHRYDVIVSNPPYIPENEKENLAINVAAFEPAIALFVPDNNPFIFYEHIAKFAVSHLRTNGDVYTEIHENYRREVQKIFAENNFKTEIKKDMYGKERMLKASNL
jgi:release factor glutamine methyltransferase